MSRFAFSFSLLAFTLVSCSGEGSSPNPKGTGVAPAPAPAPTQKEAPKAKIDFKATTLPELEKLIADQKGKVVFVDFWIDTCIPCKQGFPHLAKLHEEKGKDGLVIITVNLDQPGSPNAGNAKKYLEEKGFGFTTLRLADKEDKNDWFDKKLKIEGVPYAWLYGRAGGKPVKTYLDKPDTAELDKLIDEELKKK